ncbi:phosphatase PAP2 family protein [Niabella ginsenosidivorans]|nr:phosphatase PAP2 family protein [Niabella ginsenosidivorans]
MQSVQNFTAKNRIFINFLIVFTLVTALPSLLVPKEYSFYWLNFFHCRELDHFFIAYTYVGDGLFSILLVLLFFVFKKRLLSFHLLLSFLFSGIVAQVLKSIVRLPRPMAALGTGSYHYFIEGVTHSGYNSFPSGHTASAFALALLCGFYIKDFRVQLLLFFLACVVGYSRIYLGQHFLPDVFAGMLIGCGTAISVRLFIKCPVWIRESDRLTEQLNATA